MDERVIKTINSLQMHNMAGYFVSTKDELFDLLSNLIPPKSTVGCEKA